MEAIKPIQESKGMPKGLGKCRIKVLQNMDRHVKTAGSISQGSFGYNINNTIGGIGQESGSGPQDGNYQIGVIKDVHEDTTPGYTLSHPTGDPEQEDTRHGPGFIDDQFDLIALRTQQAESLKQFIQDTLQHWQNLLKNVTGGDLNLSKCSFGFMQYAFGYHPKGDRAQLKTIVDNPGDIWLSCTTNHYCQWP